MKTYRLYLSFNFLLGFIACMSIPSILKILGSTGRSGTTKKAYRRYIGTVLHTMSWYTEPLTPQSQLWESIEHVRKTHLRSSHVCEQQQLGPITQRDLVIAQFCLIGFTLLGADRVGIHDERFLESNTHLWRVLGSLLGIKDEYNVCAASWAETKPRFELLLERVIQPSLTTAGSDFYEISTVVVESLRSVHQIMSVDATLFCLKRLVGLRGYEVLDSDYKEDDHQAARDKKRFFSLKLQDQLIVRTVVVMFTCLYRISVIRWYLNFVTLLRLWVQDHFPYQAIYKYGWRWAYVRVFNGTKNKML